MGFPKVFCASFGVLWKVSVVSICFNGLMGF